MNEVVTPENQRFRILVADDEQAVLDAFHDALAKVAPEKPADLELDSLSSKLFRTDLSSVPDAASYDLVFCHQGQDAVETVQKAVADKHPFSIAFLDVRMPPGITGVLAGERIRKADPNINIVLVTGYTDVNPRDIAELIPPPDKFLYFQKPFNRMEIQQLAAALSAKWKVERELLSVKAELEVRVIERDQALTETNRLLEEEKFTRRRYRDSLRVNRFELKAILGFVQAGIVVVDAQTGSILDANEHAIEILGAGHKRALLGHSCSRFLCHGQSPVCLLRDSSTFETGTVEQTLIRMDGSQIPIRKSAVRVHHGDREVILETFIDVSRELQTRVKLAALEHRMDHAQHIEAVSSLTLGIAHDFNNILQALLGYTEEALHQVGPDDKIRDSLEWILKRTQAARPLVAQLQALSGQTEEERKSVRPELLLRQTLDLVRAAIHPHIQLHEEIREPAGAIRVEITQIHKILEDMINLAQMNLGTAGGVLSVSLDETGWIPGKMKPDEEPDSSQNPLGFVRVTVCCEALEGTPIPKDADETLCLLDTVQEVLLKHDGDLEVRREQPSQVTYLIYLPLVPREQPQTGHIAAPEAPLTGSERLLFVDDDEALTHLAVEALGRLGYRVDAQTRSRQAIERFCQNPAGYDVVITDLTMPELTGYALAKRILQVQPAIPIILCTAHNNILNERLARSIGIAKFLCKPYLVRDLARAIREVLHPLTKANR
ncbi:MAG TPA: response regulator [Candidatus Sumerlaeota bacterium]|nr:response regulator [Candidatus Sumerlaeota bacterium]HPS00169.1 response regulator [Candidatus Sumerlaeota bacterium]